MLRTRRMAILVAVIAVSALVAACGGSPGGSSSSARALRASTPSASSTADAPQFPAYTATATQTQVDVHSSPGGPTTLNLPNPQPLGTPLTLLLTPPTNQTVRGWLQAYLPVRPNGSTGWVPASEVKVQGDPYHIVVIQSQHLLDLYYFAAVQRTYPVAVGAPATPTPLGTYFITELLKTTNPGVYGDYAYGLSGHSPTLTTFDGYDAQIGLHGTGDPSSIGQSVSHGCVRLNNSDIDSLVPILPLGTPVDIES